MKNKLKTSSSLLLLIFILFAIILYVFKEYFKASVYLICSGSIVLSQLKPLESTEKINKDVNLIVLIITTAMLFISVVFLIFSMLGGNIFGLLFINYLTKINNLIFSLLLFMLSFQFLFNLICIFKK